MQLGVYMKLALSILATTAAITLSSQTFAAGQVNFTGEIVNASCNIDIDGSQTGEVALGKWPTSTFDKTGEKSVPKPFNINVSECLPGTYNFHFEGTADSTNTNFLKVSDAIGVGIAIANKNSVSNLVKINTAGTVDSNASATVLAGQKTATLPLQAYYQSTADTVTAGKANATVRVTLEQK